MGKRQPASAYNPHMDSAQLDALVAWIGTHPLAAGAAIFALAFCDAIVLLGVLVPLMPIFFAVGALIGVGSIDGLYAIACASAGAFCGDGLSYWFGHHYGQRLKRMWPFAKHPQWLDGGEQFFRKHGTKGIVIARYVGAVRPFVPAIAGMLRVPFRRYALPSLFACVTWAALFLAPGWIFGASIDLFQAIAGRLAIVLGLLVGALVLIYLLVNSLYRILAPRAAAVVESMMAWSHRHPVLGRFSTPLIDPNQPESASLALLAGLLLLAGFGFTWMLVEVVGRGEPLAFDLFVHQEMFALRTPFADHLMAAFSTLGDWQVIGPSAAAVLAWLLWRRRRAAAMHWAAAIAFGLAAVELLGRVLTVPKPPLAMAVAGFSFPAEPVTFATIVYGFFAVLVARELPGRKRAWPYVLAALLVTLVTFSRLYFGAHWASDAGAGMLLGLAWISLLGLAYRRHFTRSFWVRPVAAVFYSSVLLFGTLHAARNSADALAKFEVPRQIVHSSAEDWWQHGWQELPAQRNDFSRARAWPFNLQYAGSLGSLREALQKQGWQTVPTPGWTALLRSLDRNATADTLPLLSATHAGRREALVMIRPGDTPTSRQVLRLWESDLRLEPDGSRVWLGSLARSEFTELASLLWVWNFAGADAAGGRALAAALPSLQFVERQRADSRLRTTLIRER